MGYNKSRVAYCYDENIGNYHYGPGHPMKPLRVKMCHNLVMNYDLFKHLNIIEHKPASKERLTQYHSEDYINFLEKINPKNAPILRKELSNFNVGEDCPVFEGIYDYNALAAGGTIEAVAQLNHNKADIAINWSGGLHHAKRCEASGFCYVNDIVLGILELLRYHPKVLYIDIDVHHGDGVEEAFFATDRVMTLSFHKFGEFFPGTGDLRDIGYGEGKYHSINVPLRSGIDDNTFQQIFEPVTRACIEWYNPSAIVLQCGADSLAGDRLGCFNLSATGHSNCVKFVKSLNLPMLVLGGGGYTVRNVARCWTKETGVILNQELENKLPVNDYYDFYGPEYQLEVEPLSIENLNTKSYIQSITEKVINNIRRCQINPNVQLHETPGDLVDRMDVDDDEDNPDVRINKRLANSLLAHDNEYFGGKYDTKEKDKSGYNLDVTPTGSRADAESDEESQGSNAKSDTPAERTFSRRPTLGMSAQWDGFHTVHPAPQVQLNSPGNFQDTPNTQSPIFFVGSPQSNSGESKQFNGDGVQNGSDNNDSKLRLSPPAFNLNSNDEDKSSVKGSQTSSPTSRRSPRIMQQNLNNSTGDRSEKEGEDNKMDWEAIDKELDWSMEDTNTNNNTENNNGDINNNGNSNENNNDSNINESNKMEVDDNTGEGSPSTSAKRKTMTD